jgi:ketosteroid isomerase-like protein
MPGESRADELEKLLQRQIDAVHRRDYEAVVALYAPDAVWGTSPMGIGVFEGHSAIRGSTKTGSMRTLTSKPSWRSFATSATV